MHERIRDSYEYPTDLGDDSDARGAFRWTVVVIAITATLLALTNATAISGWASSFDPKPGIYTLVDAADGWEAATARLGLGTPHAEMHQVWKRAEAARWSDRNPFRK
jgi:hypothetical protein